MTYSVNLGPIRPPSEAHSLLIRATINCPWNRCKFCTSYKGQKFRLRTIEEIKQDVTTAKAIYDKLREFSWKSGYGGDLTKVAGMVLNSPPSLAFHNVALWLSAGGESVFLQDANSLIMKTNELAEVVRFIKENFPQVKRITSYARSKTAAKKKPEEMIELCHAGLSRLHIGLESGYDPVLGLIDKGETAADHIAGGRRVVESGIELSEYVIIGLGGKEMWREHAIQTARVLNEITPDFIRIRTLNTNSRTALYAEVEAGNFIPLTDEDILVEEKLLIENLECHSNIVSDHIGNLLQEVEGKLPQDKRNMLAVIDRFQALPPEERANFRVGRRLGAYTFLDDLKDSHKHEAVDRVVHRLSRGGNQVDEKEIRNLMEGFI